VQQPAVSAPYLEQSPGSGHPSPEEPVGDGLRDVPPVALVEWVYELRGVLKLIQPAAKVVVDQAAVRAAMEGELVPVALIVEGSQRAVAAKAAGRGTATFVVRAAGGFIS